MATIETMEPIGLQIQDVVGVSGVGRTSVFAAIKEGKLKARTTGHRTIVMAADVRDWLNSLPLTEPAQAAASKVT